MTKKCKYCLVEFEAKRSTATFCSDSHRTLFGKLSDAEKAEKEVAFDKSGEQKKEPEKKVPDAPKVKKAIKEPVHDKPVERDKDLQAVIDKINKDFGPGTVFRGSDKQLKIEAISTGSIGIDKATGIGGLPRGRIVEIYGPESSGKTTLALHVLATAQKMGLQCALVDAEHSFDPEYAEAIGVNVDTLEFNQPDYGEQGLEIVSRFVTSGKYGVIMVDSVAALLPKAELEGESGDAKMGLHARLMGQACRRLTGVASKTKTLVIFINQLRTKIDNYNGPSEITTGGNALKFFASMRLDVRKMAFIKDGEVQVANRVRVKVSKNKCAPPFKFAEVDVLYGEGISRHAELVDMGVTTEVLEKKTSWYYYDGFEKPVQGKDALMQLLRDNDGLADEIEKKIREKISY